MSLCFYISGHGFGHASRDIEVINTLMARDPHLEIIVRTSAARWLFELTVRGRIAFHEVECDTGVVQIDSLRLDAAETIRRSDAFHANLAARADAEARFLRESGVSLVVADIPPLAFAAAARASIPSVGLCNFTWDWILEGYPDELAAAPRLVPRIRRAYRRAARALRLPMWGGFVPFGGRIIDVPFIARHSRYSKPEARRVLGLPADDRLVLASFGGHGIAGLALDRLGAMRGCRVVTTGHSVAASVHRPSDGVIVLDERRLYQTGSRYEDLVRAVDAVATKPGYGIIAECLANDTALLYTDRGHFVEYDVLVAAIPQFLRCQHIPQDDLCEGRWEPWLDRLLTLPAPRTRPPTNGAEMVADYILASRGGQL